MEAIILAGGFGTRLKSVVKDVPKPMAKIGKKPFLAYLVGYLSSFGITDVILSVGYKQDKVQEYFRDKYAGVKIQYSCEDTPLGTGGAIKKALDFATKRKVLVLNGDTFLGVNFMDLVSKHESDNSDIVMCLKKMHGFDRYGSVTISDGKVVNFMEKRFTKEGYINTGVYMLSKKIFDKVDSDSFSFEDFMQSNVSKLEISPFFCNDSYFIDIGIPSDYEKCNIDFKEIF